MSRRALVIGGSLGGLIAAHLLRSTGWEAVVFERNEEELAGRGVGLGTHPQLIGILRRAGIDFDESMGLTPSSAVCLDRNGRIVIERPTARTLSGWSRLYRALLDGLPAQTHRLGKRLVRVAQHGASVTAFFADGSSERGDLLVGADGIRSAVRAQFLPDVQPLYAGYVAIRPEVIARIKADARATIAPQIAEIFVRTAPFFQPIYDLASPRLVFGRVVLAGDAAFVARPHAGAGTTKAALDAACLADSLREAGDDLDAGLKRYERMQAPFGKALVEVNRAEGAYLSAQLKPKADRTPAELTRDLGAVVDAHIFRSEQVGGIVAAHGLDVHVNAPF
jgi:2-polyprenyl-6-methoxyphenol hydroxylase-like FAD-dependent oxidoreductase